MHATILSHASLESSLAFHLANQLSSPAMISTQIQALILETFERDYSLQESVRKDIIAVINRDPAVRSSTDVLLYFKGYPALDLRFCKIWKI
jgi:serine O-acetyltransferase